MELFVVAFIFLCIPVPDIDFIIEIMKKDLHFQCKPLINL